MMQEERNLFHSLDSDHYHGTNEYFYFGSYDQIDPDTLC